MTQDDTVKLKHHLDECGPCLQEYDLDQALKTLVKRSCACEEAPVELRTEIMARITTIRYQISE
jgi:mycothiol system anti-sigma-R factor